MTKVVNLKLEPYDEYAGRGSIFGNPYEIGKDGTREDVIERYKKWWKFLLSDDRFLRELMKLKGKKLGCFCKRKKLADLKDGEKDVSCHCDIIVEYLNNI